MLEHYSDWVAVKGGNGDMDDTRNQIAYSRTAEGEWFKDHSYRGKLLQDVWINRIKNRDPARGCLRKVISMVRIASDNKIHLKRKSFWFCEARRHAGTYSFVPNVCREKFGLQDDAREVGDREEIVLFTTKSNYQEVGKLFEKYFNEAADMFTNKRCKDQAAILVALLQQKGYYPIRGVHATSWVTERKRLDKIKVAASESSAKKTTRRKRGRDSTDSEQENKKTKVLHAFPY